MSSSPQGFCSTVSVQHSSFVCPCFCPFPLQPKCLIRPMSCGIASLTRSIAWLDSTGIKRTVSSSTTTKATGDMQIPAPLPPAKGFSVASLLLSRMLPPLPYSPPPATNPKLQNHIALPRLNRIADDGVHIHHLLDLFHCRCHHTLNGMHFVFPSNG